MRGPWAPSTIRSRRCKPLCRSSSSRSETRLTGGRRSIAPAGGVGARGRLRVGERLPFALDHPKLGRGIPEVRLRLAVDQLVDRRLGRRAAEPPGAVVGAGIRPVVLLAGDVEAELGEHLAVV